MNCFCDRLVIPCGGGVSFGAGADTEVVLVVLVVVVVAAVVVVGGGEVDGGCFGVTRELVLLIDVDVAVDGAGVVVFEFLLEEVDHSKTRAELRSSSSRECYVLYYLTTVAFYCWTNKTKRRSRRCPQRQGTTTKVGCQEAGETAPRRSTETSASGHFSVAFMVFRKLSLRITSSDASLFI